MTSSNVRISGEQHLCWEAESSSAECHSSERASRNRASKYPEEKERLPDSVSTTAHKKVGDQTPPGDKTPTIHLGDPREGCCWEGKAFFDAIKALVTRQLFLLHSILVVWRAVAIAGPQYWLLLMFVSVQVLESLCVLVFRRGQEWKWFSPCVFVYLGCTIPGIWVLELAVNQRNFISSSNNQQTQFSEAKANIGGISLNLTEEQWTRILEQVMLVLIIIGRWLLPKGELTRDQLSGLLLAHLGTASDIVDFFSIIQEDIKISQSKFIYVILTIWTWSMLQFSFVRTVTYDGKGGHEVTETMEEGLSRGKQSKTSLKRLLWTGAKELLETESWSIILGLVMQDGPFFVTRLITIGYFRIFTSSNLFFLVKNLLILILQLYRLYSIYREHKENKKRAKEERTKHLLKTLYRNAFFLYKSPHEKVSLELDYQDEKS